ncbi:DNA-dependent RNA polymerase family protein [Leishmania donovani]|uniref:DNA-directed RNA polymerase n=1 Tax=Leishmania donovani TaxID=5661 RepID=A0A504X795_LEIDO|nr:DNA-dependent RNA polymerase family protein [Leishmania donovani]
MSGASSPRLPSEVESISRSYSPPPPPSVPNTTRRSRSQGGSTAPEDLPGLHSCGDASGEASVLQCGRAQRSEPLSARAFESHHSRSLGAALSPISPQRTSRPLSGGGRQSATAAAATRQVRLERELMARVVEMNELQGKLEDAQREAEQQTPSPCWRVCSSGGRGQICSGSGCEKQDLDGFGRCEACGASRTWADAGDTAQVRVDTAAEGGKEMGSGPRGPDGADLQQLIRDLRANLARRDTALNEAQMELGSLQHIRQTLEAELRRLQGSLSDVKAQRDALQARLTAQEELHTAKVAQVSGLEEQVQQLTKEKDAVQSRLTTAQLLYEHTGPMSDGGSPASPTGVGGGRVHAHEEALREQLQLYRSKWQAAEDQMEHLHERISQLQRQLVAGGADDGATVRPLKPVASELCEADEAVVQKAKYIADMAALRRQHQEQVQLHIEEEQRLQRRLERAQENAAFHEDQLRQQRQEDARQHHSEVQALQAQLRTAQGELVKAQEDREHLARQLRRSTEQQTTVEVLRSQVDQLKQRLGEVGAELAQVRGREKELSLQTQRERLERAKVEHGLEAAQEMLEREKTEAQYLREELIITREQLGMHEAVDASITGTGPARSTLSVTCAPSATDAEGDAATLSSELKGYVGLMRVNAALQRRIEELEAQAPTRHGSDIGRCGSKTSDERGTQQAQLTDSAREGSALPKASPDDASPPSALEQQQAAHLQAELTSALQSQQALMASIAEAEKERHQLIKDNQTLADGVELLEKQLRKYQAKLACRAIAVDTRVTRAEAPPSAPSADVKPRTHADVVEAEESQRRCCRCDCAQQWDSRVRSRLQTARARDHDVHVRQSADGTLRQPQLPQANESEAAKPSLRPVCSSCRGCSGRPAASARTKRSALAASFDSARGIAVTGAADRSGFARCHSPPCAVGKVAELGPDTGPPAATQITHDTVPANLSHWDGLPRTMTGAAASAAPAARARTTASLTSPFICLRRFFWNPFASGTRGSVSATRDSVQRLNAEQDASIAEKAHRDADLENEQLLGACLDLLDMCSGNAAGSAPSSALDELARDRIWELVDVLLHDHHRAPAEQFDLVYTALCMPAAQDHRQSVDLFVVRDDEQSLHQRDALMKFAHAQLGDLHVPDGLAEEEVLSVYVDDIKTAFPVLATCPAWQVVERDATTIALKSKLFALLGRLCAEFDEEKTGKVKLADLRSTAERVLGTDQASRLLEGAQVDKDGKIAYAQLVALLSRPPPKKRAPAEVDLGTRLTSPLSSAVTGAMALLCGNIATASRPSGTLTCAMRYYTAPSAEESVCDVDAKTDTLTDAGSAEARAERPVGTKTSSKRTTPSAHETKVAGGEGGSDVVVGRTDADVHEGGSRLVKGEAGNAAAAAGADDEDDDSITFSEAASVADLFEIDEVKLSAAGADSARATEGAHQHAGDHSGVSGATDRRGTLSAFALPADHSRSGSGSTAAGIEDTLLSDPFHVPSVDDDAFARDGDLPASAVASYSAVSSPQNLNENVLSAVDVLCDDLFHCKTSVLRSFARTRSISAHKKVEVVLRLLEKAHHDAHGESNDLSVTRRLLGDVFDENVRTSGLRMAWTNKSLEAAHIEEACESHLSFDLLANSTKALMVRRHAGEISRVLRKLTRVFQQEQEQISLAAVGGVFRNYRAAADELVRELPVCELLSPFAGYLVSYVRYGAAKETLTRADVNERLVQLGVVQPTVQEADDSALLHRLMGLLDPAVQQVERRAECFRHAEQPRVVGMENSDVIASTIRAFSEVSHTKWNTQAAPDWVHDLARLFCNWEAILRTDLPRFEEVPRHFFDCILSGVVCLYIAQRVYGNSVGATVVPLYQRLAVKKSLRLHFNNDDNTESALRDIMSYVQAGVTEVRGGVRGEFFAGVLSQMQGAFQDAQEERSALHDERVAVILNAVCDMGTNCTRSAGLFNLLVKITEDLAFHFRFQRIYKRLSAPDRATIRTNGSIRMSQTLEYFEKELHVTPISTKAVGFLVVQLLYLSFRGDGSKRPVLERFASVTGATELDIVGLTEMAATSVRDLHVAFPPQLSYNSWLNESDTREKSVYGVLPSVAVKGSANQAMIVSQAPMLKALDAISRVPWRINKYMLHVQEAIRRQCILQQKQDWKELSELRSSRIHYLLGLRQARSMCNPFRGLLEYAEPKPLGAVGLYWLKVHLANKMGMSKLSFDERVHYVDEHMEDVVQSAESPLVGDRWWQEASEPIQCLMACKEVADAMKCSQGPEKFLSRLPVAVDGSYNGLQHYSAIGRDAFGAKLVNLVPSERPADAYTGILKEMLKSICIDAGRDHQVAQRCLGTGRGQDKDHIKRKTIKRPIMTQVYGVTSYGMSEQIFDELVKQNKSHGLWTHTDMKEMAAYLRDKVLESLGITFRETQNCRKWISEVTTLLWKVQPAELRNALCWTTPLGLVVRQPYKVRNECSLFTPHGYSRVPGDSVAPASRKQLTAIAPNLIHSLDATHLAMTALEMQHQGLSMMAVHDSYWTYACDMPKLSQVLREQFLKEQWEETYFMDLRRHGVKLPDPPKRGDLDLNVVLNSPYFFS